MGTSSGTAEKKIIQNSPRVKIKGANYDALDTEDGYFIVKDVPIFSEIPKGEHGAPYDVTKEKLDLFLETMRNEYQRGSFTGALAVGHNDNFGITHPNFCGYFLPTKVELYKFGSGETKWTIFADFKIKADKFEKVLNAELPFHSPEIYDWERHTIDIVSFLDTKPPFFRYALFTVAKVTRDPAATFQAKYQEDEEQKPEVKPGEKAESKESPAGEPGEQDESKQFATRIAGLEASMMKVMQSLGIANAMGEDPMDKKPDALPVEPIQEEKKKEVAAMSLDPEMAAKFAAQANDLAELKRWREEREAETKSSELITKAKDALAKKSVSSALMEQISGFAAEAVSRKDGVEWFGKFIESLKASLRDKPPGTMAEFQTGGVVVEPADPAIARFSQEGPDVLEAVAKFAAQFRTLKQQLGDRMQCTEENFIKNELGLWKSMRTESRR